MSDITSNEQFYAGLQYLPKPQYPFPDFIHPDFQRIRQEYYDWIDKEYTFHSETAREKHKAHNLVDIASRGLPFLKDLAELRPLANYTANGAMMDDYLDRCSRDEMMQVGKRIVSLLTGEESIEPSKEENGIFHQFWILRQDALKCGMPERHYKKYIASMNYSRFTGQRTDGIKFNYDAFALVSKNSSSGMYPVPVCLRRRL